MSNLALKLMNAGFLGEAEEELLNARKIDDYHRTVDVRLADLKDIPNQENEKLEEVLEKARRKVEFYKSLGAAIAASEITIRSGKWRSTVCDLEVSVSSNALSAIGAYEVSNALGGLFSQATILANKYEVEYECTIVGRALEGTVRRKQLGETYYSLLSSAGDGRTKVLMVLSDDARKLEVLENPYSNNPSFYSLTQAEL